MTQFALIYAKEDHRRGYLKSALTKVINYPLANVNNPDKTSPDLVAMGQCGSLQTYLVVAEDKNEFGDGGSDPSVRAAFSFQRIFCQEQVMPSTIHFPLFRWCRLRIERWNSSEMLLSRFHDRPCRTMICDYGWHYYWTLHCPATHRLFLDSRPLYPWRQPVPPDRTCLLCTETVDSVPGFMVQRYHYRSNTFQRIIASCSPPSVLPVSQRIPRRRESCSICVSSTTRVRYFLRNVSLQDSWRQSKGHRRQVRHLMVQTLTGSWRPLALRRDFSTTDRSTWSQASPRMAICVWSWWSMWTD